MQLCYDLSLTGIGYDRDNQQAWQLIQKWTIHDPIYNWLKPFELTEDGRGAWLALKAQMEGVAAINSRANAATRTLGMGQGSALWTNEYTSPFMSYATTLQQAYTSLEKCHGVDTPPATRVQRLLDGMKPSDKQVLIAIAKSHVADNLMQDWVGAVQYLQAKVDAAFPPRNHMAASVDSAKYMRLDPQVEAALEGVAVLDVAGDVHVDEADVAAGDAEVIPNTLTAWTFLILTACLLMPSSVN